METLIPAVVQVVVYLILLVVITKYLGIYMAQVFEGQRNILSPLLVPVERAIYRLFRINPKREQSWVAYTSAMLAFSVVGLLSSMYLRASSRTSTPIKQSTHCRVASRPSWVGRLHPRRPSRSLVLMVEDL